MPSNDDGNASPQKKKKKLENEEAASIRLVKLTEDGCAILRAAGETSLATGLVNIIGLLGGHVVDELPEYARDHAAVIGGYLKTPTAGNTIQVIVNIS